MSPVQKEHRLNPRLPVKLDALLHVPGQKPFPGLIRNASIGGLLVETDASRLYGDAEVYVAITLPMKQETIQYRIPAKHVRQAGNGVGLMFTDPGMDTIHTLREWLYPAPSLVPPSTQGDATPQRRQA